MLVDAEKILVDKKEIRAEVSDFFSPLPLPFPPFTEILPCPASLAECRHLVVAGTGENAVCWDWREPRGPIAELLQLT